MVTTEQLVGLTAQHNEIIKRVGNGSLDPASVKEALQYIIQRQFHKVEALWAQPSWQTGVSQLPSWLSALTEQQVIERQLANMRQWNAERGWGLSEADFAFVTETFPGFADGLFPVLANYLPRKGRKAGLQRAVDEFWDLTRAPNGYSKLQRNRTYLNFLNGSSLPPKSHH